MINLLPQKCNIKRNLIVKDEYGTPTETFTVIYTAIKCRLSRSNRAKREQQNPQDTVSPEYVLYVMHNADIKAGDVIEVDEVEYTAGEPYKAYGAIRLHHKEIPVNVVSKEV